MTTKNNTLNSQEFKKHTRWKKLFENKSKTLQYNCVAELDIRPCTMECTIKHNSTMDSKGPSLYRTTEYLNECIRSLVGTLKYWYTSKSEIKW
jgi:hypothetical protein